MSAVELAIERVRALDEASAEQLLTWLRTRERPAPSSAMPRGARAMLGFARRFRAHTRTTADWMLELREGERD